MSDNKVPWDLKDLITFNTKDQGKLTEDVIFDLRCM